MKHYTQKDRRCEVLTCSRSTIFHRVACSIILHLLKRRNKFGTVPTWSDDWARTQKKVLFKYETFCCLFPFLEICLKFSIDFLKFCFYFIWYISSFICIPWIRNKTEAMADLDPDPHYVCGSKALLFRTACLCNCYMSLSFWQDFYGDEYKAHNQCMSEDQRYVFQYVTFYFTYIYIFLA